VDFAAVKSSASAENNCHALGKINNKLTCVLSDEVLVLSVRQELVVSDRSSVCLLKHNNLFCITSKGTPDLVKTEVPSVSLSPEEHSTTTDLAHSGRTSDTSLTIYI
jgi:hypothetical protein